MARNFRETGAHVGTEKLDFLTRMEGIVGSKVFMKPIEGRLEADIKDGSIIGINDVAVVFFGIVAFSFCIPIATISMKFINANRFR